jgi:hypothetical protein
MQPKQNIKERPVTIMKQIGKSGVTKLMSIMVLVAIISCAVLLGACGRAVNEDSAGENQAGGSNAGATELEGDNPGDSANTSESIAIRFESNNEFPEQYKEQFTSYIAGLFTEKYTPYYQVLGFEFTNVDHVQTDNALEVTFFLKMIVQNYYKDPDTVEYIKQAKENGSKYYKQLYDEYNQPKESNYDLKFTAGLSDGQLDMDSIQLFTNVHPKGVEYVPIGEDFFP